MIVQPVPTMVLSVDYFKKYRKAAHEDLSVYVHAIGERLNPPTAYFWISYFSTGKPGREGIFVNTDIDTKTIEELCDYAARIQGYTY